MILSGKILLYFCLISIFQLFFSDSNICYSQILSSRKTVVLGFINLGESSDDSINIIMTKSLISFLLKLPDIQVINYEELEKIVSEKNLWKLKNPDIDLSFQIAQSLGAKEMILGDYKVDSSSKKIVINLYGYNVVTGELDLKRNYESTTGIGLFDTVDLIKKNSAGLFFGKEVQLGKLSIEITDSTNHYKIYINGKQSGEISFGNEYNEQYLAGEEMEMSLKTKESDKEVLRKTVTLTNNTETKIIYKPIGNVIVKSFLKNSTFKFNGNIINEINKDGSFVLTEIPANKTNLIELINKNKIVDSTNIIINEGETIIIVFNNSYNMSNFKSQPLMNILLPGFAQFQSNDYKMGTIFILTGIGGLGLSVFSSYAYSISYSKYERSVTDSDISKYKNISETWNYLDISGLCIWGGAVVISIIHAYIQPSFYSFEPYIDINQNGNIGFSFIKRF